MKAMYSYPNVNIEVDFTNELKANCGLPLDVQIDIESANIIRDLKYVLKIVSSSTRSRNEEIILQAMVSMTQGKKMCYDVNWQKLETKLNLKKISLGCCDNKNEWVFSGASLFGSCLIWICFYMSHKDHRFISNALKTLDLLFDDNSLVNKRIVVGCILKYGGLVFESD